MDTDSSTSGSGSGNDSSSDSEEDLRDELKVAKGMLGSPHPKTRKAAISRVNKKLEDQLEAKFTERDTQAEAAAEN